MGPPTTSRLSSSPSLGDLEVLRRLGDSDRQLRQIIDPEPRGLEMDLEAGFGGSRRRRRERQNPRHHDAEDQPKATRHQSFSTGRRLRSGRLHGLARLGFGALEGLEEGLAVGRSRSRRRLLLILLLLLLFLFLFLFFFLFSSSSCSPALDPGFPALAAAALRAWRGRARSCAWPRDRRDRGSPLPAATSPQPRPAGTATTRCPSCRRRWEPRRRGPARGSESPLRAGRRRRARCPGHRVSRDSRDRASPHRQRTRLRLRPLHRATG